MLYIKLHASDYTSNKIFKKQFKNTYQFVPTYADHTPAFGWVV